VPQSPIRHKSRAFAGSTWGKSGWLAAFRHNQYGLRPKSAWHKRILRHPGAPQRFASDGRSFA